MKLHRLLKPRHIRSHEQRIASLEEQAAKHTALYDFACRVMTAAPGSVLPIPPNLSLQECSDVIAMMRKSTSVMPLLRASEPEDFELTQAQVDHLAACQRTINDARGPIGAALVQDDES